MSQKLLLSQQLFEEASRRVDFNRNFITTKIKQATGWERLDNGTWVFETNDKEKDFSAKDKPNKAFKGIKDFQNYLTNFQDDLIQKSNDKNRPLRLKDICEDKQLNMIYPDIENTQVVFTNDSISPMINVNDGVLKYNLALFSKSNKTEAGIRALISQGTQYLIQQKEGYDISDTLVNATNLDRFLQKIAKGNYAQNIDYANAETIKETINNLRSEVIDDISQMFARTVASRALNESDFNVSINDDINTIRESISKISDAAMQKIELRTKFDYDIKDDSALFQMSEEEGVRQQYFNTDQWLKAPNGANSNLNERQWCQVRTASFKKFFGDWENDPANASKVIDENGEPKVVFHDTNAKQVINKETGENWNNLDYLEKDKWRERQDWDDFWEEQDFYIFNNNNARTSIEMPAYFFAPKADPYHEYGSRRIQAFLNIRNPIADPVIENAGVTDFAGLEYMDKLIEAGYDGFIRTDEDGAYEINSFYPNQIKSATENTGSFDPENPDIRFQATDEEKATALAYLDTFEDEVEKNRILANLNHKEIGATGWADLVYQCLNVRNDLKKLFNNEEIAETSLFNDSTVATYFKLAKAGPDAIYNYFNSKDH